MPDSFRPLLSHLMTINSFSGNSRVHSTPNNFSQSKIEMRSYITSKKGQYVLKGLCHVPNFSQENQSSGAVVFCTSRKQSQHFCDHLERKLNKMKLNIDVIHINGLLHKIDKFLRICLFCDKTHIREATFQILVTTNADNMGINKSLIALQMQFDWPRDILAYFQERGRGSRQKGTKSMCILYANLLSYVFIVSQLSVGADDTVDVEIATNECDGINSAILP
jgi:superfamily II DNA helicase RecQ